MQIVITTIINPIIPISLLTKLNLKTQSSSDHSTMSAAIRPLESDELEDIDLENAGPSSEDGTETNCKGKKQGKDASQRRRCRMMSPVCVVVLLLVVLVLIIALSVKYARSGQSDSASSTTTGSDGTSILKACSWQRIVPPDESEGKKFGAILNVDGGKTIVVGAQGDATNGKDSGAVYVYRLDGDTGEFIFNSKLIPHDGAEGDVASYTDVSGKFVALGAKKHDHKGEDSGGVYVFMRKDDGTYIEDAELIPDELEEGDMLGNQLALDGKTLLVGARRTNDGKGAVYAYRRTKGRWRKYGDIVLPAGEQLVDDEFGGRINFKGKTAVITKNGPNKYWSDAGGAYIFHDTGHGFAELQELIPDEIDFDLYAKKAVDISEDEKTVVVGAYKTDLDGTYNGYVYVYDRGDDGMYHQSHKLTPQDENKDYLFGRDVALRGSLLLVLAESAHEDGTTGLVYVFTRDGDKWVQQSNLVPDGSLPLSTDGFGSSLAILDEGTVLIGSRYTESSSGLAKGGSAYVVRLC